MPRYFFHTRIADDEVVTDPEGEVFADPDAAWEAARITALQLLQGAGSDPVLLRAVLVVADEAGETVLEFPLAEAVDGPAPGGALH